VIKKLCYVARSTSHQDMNEMLASSSKILCACNFAINVICNLFPGILGTVSKKPFSLSVYDVLHTGDKR